jgi:hypothetical protein
MVPYVIFCPFIMFNLKPYTMLIIRLITFILFAAMWLTVATIVTIFSFVYIMLYNKQIPMQ